MHIVPSNESERAQLFAVITISSGHDFDILQQPHNSIFYRLSSSDGSSCDEMDEEDYEGDNVLMSRFTREESIEPDIFEMRRLELRFDQKLVDPSKGFTFGYRTKSGKCNADICLGSGNLRGTAFSIAPNAAHEIILTAWSGASTTVRINRPSTSVTLDGGRHFLSHGPGTQEWQSAFIHIQANPFRRIVLQIQFPNQDRPTPEYMENLSIFQQYYQQQKEQEVAVRVTRSRQKDPESSKIAEEKHEPYLQKTGNRMGSGAFGDVDKVVDMRTGKLYALKQSKGAGDIYSEGELSADLKMHNYGESCQDLQNEYGILATLDHPNIIKPLKFFDRHASARAYLMPLYTGQLSRSASGQYGVPCIELDRGQKRDVSMQLLSAVAYLHRRRIAHRDIKLDNVLYTENPLRVALADFGASKQQLDSATMNTYRGTEYNMAPELFIARKYDGKYAVKYKKSADVWSLGFALFKMLRSDFPLFYCWAEQQGSHSRQSYDEWLENLETIVEGMASTGDPIMFIIMDLLQRDPMRRGTAQGALDKGRILELWHESLLDPFVDSRGYVTGIYHLGTMSNCNLCLPEIVRQSVVSRSDVGEGDIASSTKPYSPYARQLTRYTRTDNLPRIVRLQMQKVALRRTLSGSNRYPNGKRVGKPPSRESSAAAKREEEK